MSAVAFAFDDDVIEPTSELAAAASEATRVLGRHSSEPRVRLRVEGDEDGSIVLPADIFKQFVKLLAQIANGQAVSIVPIFAELTTQQAAHFLNVSRPHVIKLIDRGELQHRMVGTHRKLPARDLMIYRARIDLARTEALNRMAAFDEEFGADDSSGSADNTARC